MKLISQLWAGGVGYRLVGLVKSLKGRVRGQTILVGCFPFHIQSLHLS